MAFCAAFLDSPAFPLLSWVFLLLPPHPAPTPPPPTYLLRGPLGRSKPDLPTYCMGSNRREQTPYLARSRNPGFQQLFRGCGMVELVLGGQDHTPYPFGPRPYHTIPRKKLEPSFISRKKFQVPLSLSLHVCGSYVHSRRTADRAMKNRLFQCM